MNELISVIVPVYNVDNYVKNCIESIIRQTYKNIEIIIVDDGSTDKSGEICDEIAECDSRIEVYHKGNGGLSSARNYGIKQAEGNYYVFVDSDDWIKDTMVECLYSAVIESNAEIACCGRIIIDDKGNKEELHIDENRSFSCKEIIEKTVFDEKIGVAAWGKIYHKSLFEEIIFPEGEIHEDVAIIYKLFDKCNIIYAINRPEYYYRNNPAGISKQKYTRNYNVVLKHNLQNELFISEKYPELKGLMRAATAKSCIEMMIKIVKSENGYKTFDKEYSNYRNNLKQRSLAYLKYKNLSLKELIWMLIMISGNKFMRKLYKLIGLFK